MGRLSEVFCAIQAEKMPSVHDSRIFYTHIDLTNTRVRDEIKKLKKEYKKNKLTSDEKT